MATRDWTIRIQRIGIYYFENSRIEALKIIAFGSSARAHTRSHSPAWRKRILLSILFHTRGKRLRASVFGNVCQLWHSPGIIMWRVSAAQSSTAQDCQIWPCSPESYVRCAVDLANDLPRLARLRAGMRDRLLNSTLLDGRNLAREIEQAYREVWGAWCRGEVR